MIKQIWSSATLGLRAPPSAQTQEVLVSSVSFTRAHRLEPLADGLVVQLLCGLQALLVARTRRPRAVAQVLACRAAPDALQQTLVSLSVAPQARLANIVVHVSSEGKLFSIQSGETIPIRFTSNLWSGNSQTYRSVHSFVQQLR